MVGVTGTIFPFLFQPPQEGDIQSQLSYIADKAGYFLIDNSSRAPFQYGLCLYLCWAIMVIYGVGSALYIFSGKEVNFQVRRLSSDKLNLKK